MSERKVTRSVEQRIVIKFLVGENVPSAEIHHRLQQQYGEECFRVATLFYRATRIQGRRHLVMAAPSLQSCAYRSLLVTMKLDIAAI